MSDNKPQQKIRIVTKAIAYAFAALALCPKKGVDYAQFLYEHADDPALHALAKTASEGKTLVVPGATARNIKSLKLALQQALDNPLPVVPREEADAVDMGAYTAVKMSDDDGGYAMFYGIVGEVCRVPDLNAADAFVTNCKAPTFTRAREGFRLTDAGRLAVKAALAN